VFAAVSDTVRCCWCNCFNLIGLMLFGACVLLHDHCESVTVNSDFRLVWHDVFMLFCSDVAGSYTYSVIVYN